MVESYKENVTLKSPLIHDINPFRPGGQSMEVSFTRVLKSHLSFSCLSPFLLLIRFLSYSVFHVPALKTLFTDLSARSPLF